MGVTALPTPDPVGRSDEEAQAFKARLELLQQTGLTRDRRHFAAQIRLYTLDLRVARIKGRPLTSQEYTFWHAQMSSWTEHSDFREFTNASLIPLPILRAIRAATRDWVFDRVGIWRSAYGNVVMALGIIERPNGSDFYCLGRWTEKNEPLPTLQEHKRRLAEEARTTLGNMTKDRLARIRRITAYACATLAVIFGVIEGVLAWSSMLWWGDLLLATGTGVVTFYLLMVIVWISSREQYERYKKAWNMLEMLPTVPDVEDYGPVETAAS